MHGWREEIKMHCTCRLIVISSPETEELNLLHLYDKIIHFFKVSNGKQSIYTMGKEDTREQAQEVYQPIVTTPGKFILTFPATC